MTLRALLAFLMLVAISGTASAQSLERIEIAEPGIYQAGQKKGARPEPGTPTGIYTELRFMGLVQATTTIVANQGVIFGFRYSTFGKFGAPVRLKFVTNIPEPGIRNPKTGVISLRSEYFETVMVGGTEFKGFSFDEPWEIVAGTWTIEIWDGDRKLVSQDFNIVSNSRL